MTELFMTVLDISLKASFVILSVCLTRWFMCLGNPPRKWCYMLWGIVLIRLLVPFSMESSFSSLPDDFAQSITTEWGDDYIGETHTYFDVTEEFETAVEHGNRPITTDEGGQYVVTGADGVSQPKTVKTEILPILAKLWLAGIAGMLLWNGLAMWKLMRRLREAVPLDHQIYLSDQIDTAFVVGFGQGRIYLPANLTEAEQSHILRHEQHHLQRGDHRIKLLAFLALCVHWFNPLVWLAYALAMRDMELSCDEAVTAQLGEADKADYAQTLLSLTTGHKRFHAAPVAFGEGDTDQRVRHVFRYRPAGKAVTAIVMVLILFLAIRLLTDPKEVSYEFGASMYGYEQSVYTDDSLPYEVPYSFCLTTDNVFWALTETKGWNEFGSAVPYTVTADEMNRMLRYRLTMDDPPAITKITDSKIVTFTDETGQHLFYLLTRHKDGRYYIAYGVSADPQYTPDQMTVYRLFPVKSGVGKTVAHEPFYQRTLESMLDTSVDVFATHLIGDGYHVIGFCTDVPKTNYGWAVFHVQSNMVTFTGQMELFENAAEVNHGILYGSQPALANDTGEITDETAYDVVLIANPDIVSLERRITNQDGSETLKRYPEITPPDMILLPWTETAGAGGRAANNFYDAEGALVPDSEEIERLLELSRSLEDAIEEREALFAAVREGESATYCKDDTHPGGYVKELIRTERIGQEVTNCIHGSVGAVDIRYQYADYYQAACTLCDYSAQFTEYRWSEGTCKIIAE